MYIANTIGVTLVILFLFFLFGKKHKSTADILLIILQVSMGCFFLTNMWVAYWLTPLSFFLQQFFTACLFFPLVAYALLLIESDHQFKKWWWLFILPDALGISYLFIDLFISNRLNHTSIESIFYESPMPYLIYYKGQKVFILITFYWLFIKLRKYQKLLKDYYSNTAQMSFQWLKSYLFVHSTVIIINQLFFVPYNLGYLKSIETPLIITQSSLAVLLFYLFYEGIKLHTLADFSEWIKPEKEKQKYQTSSFSSDNMKNLFAQIKTIFEHENLFRDSELRVQDLAKRLEVSNHNISQTLNTQANKSFYDFVNEYRVNYLKQLLIDPEKQKFTILALALESGFNSKATLNRVFKQIEGVSPREFQKGQLQTT